MPNGHPLSRTPRFAMQNVSRTAKLQQTIVLPHSAATQAVFDVLASPPCKNVALASVGRTISGRWLVGWLCGWLVGGGGCWAGMPTPASRRSMREASGGSLGGSETRHVYLFFCLILFLYFFHVQLRFLKALV